MSIFKKEATAVPGQDPGDTSTSGLGSLAVKAVQKAIDDEVLNTNTVNTPLSNLRSLIVTDPSLLDEGIDVSGLRTQTDTDPRLLASIADFPGISYDPTSFDYLSDLNELFAYGLPGGDTSGVTTPPVTTTPDTGGGGQATVPGAINTLVTPESPGGLTPSGTFAGQPTFTTTPGTTVDNITGDITNPDGSYGGNINDEVALTGGAISPTTQPIDPTGMLPQTSSSRFAAAGTLADPLEKDDVLSGAIITAEDAADPTFLDRIGLGQFNPVEAFVKAAINKSIGLPVTFLIDTLVKNLPPQDPRQVALNELYDVQDGTIQSGLMAGYNPVSGNPLDPTFGLQDAYQDRIDTIENTLKNQYNMSDAEIADVKAGTYTGDVDTVLLDRLNQLETDKAVEKARLDLFSGDIQETGDAGIAEQIAEADRLGISGNIGVEGEDVDRFTTPTNVTSDITSDFFDDFDDGTMTGIAGTMDDVLGPMPAPPSSPTGINRPGGDARDDSPAPSQPSGPPEADRRGGGADMGSVSASSAPTGISGPPSRGGSTGGPPSQGGGGGGQDSCFLPDTLVTMADGSTKKIIDVDIGDEVAEGGKVFATGKFLNNELYDYKGVKVSGSHMVNEDGVWMRIRDTKHGKPLGDDEHIVYVFGSENRRILINNILFTDYFETKEQEKLIDNEKDFFNNWKTYGDKIDQDNINILNAS